MPDGTTIGPTLRAAVIDGLAAHFAGLADFNGETDAAREVVCTYAYDFSSRDTERVYTGRSRGDTPPAAMRPGYNIRQETGFFDLTVLVLFNGGSAQDADDRAWAIGSEVEQWLGLRKSNELGVDGLQNLTIRSWAADYKGTDMGAAAAITYNVRWEARLA